MANVQHGNLTPGASSGIHVAQRWSVADATARLALSVASADVGGICFQQDVKQFYMLADTTPTWKLMPGQTSTLTAQGTTLTTATDITDAINQAAALSPAFSQHVTAVPSAGSAAWQFLGFPAAQVLDSSTLTARQNPATSRQTRRIRIGYVAAAAAINRMAGVNWFGPGVNGLCNRTEGFYASMYAQLVTPSTNGKFIMGLTGSANPMAGTSGSASNPSAVLNSLIVGNDSPGVLSAMSNDASGTATVAQSLTGTASATAGAEYFLELYAAPAGSVVYYRFSRLDTPLVFTGSFTSDLPAATTQLFPVIGYHSNTDAVQVAVDVSNFLVIVPWS